jgi:hypothetical protein
MFFLTNVSECLLAAMFTVETRMLLQIIKARLDVQVSVNIDMFLWLFNISRELQANISSHDFYAVYFLKIFKLHIF